MKTNLTVITNILDWNRVLMSGGSRDGISVGDVYAVDDDQPVLITNPATDEVLDAIWRPKELLVVSETKERYSILRKWTSKSRKPRPLSTLEIMGSKQFSLLNEEAAMVASNQKLNVDENDFNDVLSQTSGRTLRVGDTLRKI
ncbi:hypothetical protein [Weissella confusa]|uniref:hypothetical protein n=1 Tax=Weissella confusa TaxID=1583 RepID=UPI00107FD323|nr:hypothetical protein [Weissella confusa]MBJ7681558.1 hypothetical protein [Weissella confusa]MBJ7683532.1 hypothetical protein [Weissella confusa]MBJ7702126.1 hypothetical protein [Weissella confusa]TGE64961.1 hypothetical protein C6P17_06690 [Weissella confusa]